MRALTAGAVMALVEGPHTTVLYTGDFRLDGDHVRDHVLLAGRAIDRLYIDTTFFTPRASRFPSRVRPL